MLPKFSPRACATPSRLALCTALALALSACGGGGGNPGTVPGGGNTQTGVNALRPSSIQFVSSSLGGSSIVLKGTGGLGRQDSAVLTFRVLDQNNKPMSGVTVDFKPSTSVGGLTVTPASGTSDATGTVTTTVSSGTIPTPVRVQAEVSRDGTTVTGLSDTLTISTGLPFQKALSLSVSNYNIEGMEFDGVTTTVTARLADQYGNPIADGTAVSFIAEAGSIGTSARGACTTVNGACDVTFTSQGTRPSDGRVTVLAYVQGLKDFIDTNGDGQYNVGEVVLPHGDPFLDSNFNGSYNPELGELAIPYGPTYTSGAPDEKFGATFIWRDREIVLSSGSLPRVNRLVCGAGGCRDWTAADGPESVVMTSSAAGVCSSKDVAIRLSDVNNNPMPVDTALSVVEAVKVTVGPVSPPVVPSTNTVGGTIHRFTVTPDTACASGSFKLKITTPKGKSTSISFTNI